MMATEIVGEQRWTTIERLVLAHAVLKCGEGNWASVSRAVRSRLAGPLPPGSLSTHTSPPLTSSTSSLSGSTDSLSSSSSAAHNQTRVSAHFTAKRCASEFTLMVEDESRKKRPLSNSASTSPKPGQQGETNELIAVTEKLRVRRIKELQSSITARTRKIKELESEVERLKKARAELLLAAPDVSGGTGTVAAPAAVNKAANADEAPALDTAVAAVVAAPAPTTLLSSTISETEQDTDTTERTGTATSTSKPTVAHTPSSTSILRSASTGLPIPKAPSPSIKEEPDELHREAGAHQGGSSAARASAPSTPLPSESADAATAVATESPLTASGLKRRGRRPKDSGVSLDTSSSSVLSPPPMLSPASPALAQSLDDKQTRYQRAIMSSMNQVWNSVHRHKFGPLFRSPVTEEEAPGYFDVIKQPMDLSTIKERLNSGATTSPTEFYRDLMLMFQNALTYNPKESDVYYMASILKRFTLKEIQSVFSTQEALQTERPVTRRARHLASSTSEVEFDESIFSPPSSPALSSSSDGNELAKRARPKLSVSTSSIGTPTKSASASTVATPAFVTTTQSPLSTPSKLGKKRPLEEDIATTPDSASRESRPKRQRVIKEKQ